MTIESILERIATALEEQNKLLQTVGVASAPVTSPAETSPAKPAGRGRGKAAAPAPEPAAVPIPEPSAGVSTPVPAPAAPAADPFADQGPAPAADPFDEPDAATPAPAPAPAAAAPAPAPVPAAAAATPEADPFGDSPAPAPKPAPITHEHVRKLSSEVIAKFDKAAAIEILHKYAPTLPQVPEDKLVAIYNDYMEKLDR